MRFWRAALGVGATVAMVLALSSAAAANHNLLEQVTTGPNSDYISGGLSDDGQLAVFASGTQDAPGDTDAFTDVYQWKNGVTELVSAGEINGNGSADAGANGMSADGSRIWFSTKEQLVPADTDAQVDVYERYQGHTYQVSTGPMNANQPSPSGFGGASPDGTRVYFRTIEPLTLDDPDHCVDIYERAGGMTTLITTGKLSCPGSTQIEMAGYADTPDGPAVLFKTNGRMLPEDTDTLSDYYEKVGGQMRLLSQGPETTGTPGQPALRRFSPEANALLFITNERLTSDDTDDRRDAYGNVDGVLTRVSKGPAGGNSNGPDGDLIDESGGNNFGISNGGHSFFFSTAEQLTADDTDSDIDLFEYADGMTRLIGDGGFYISSSPDASLVFFRTTEQIAPGDTDLQSDLYQDQSGVVTQVTPGNAAGGSGFAGASQSHDRIFFATTDSLVPSDTCCVDLYERFNGAYYRIQTRSTGTQCCLGIAVSVDGTRLIFSTQDSLATTDTDSQYDLYRISVAPNTYARPKAATPINVAFVPAYAACTSPNRVHAAPLSFNSCSPPAQVSQYLTLGTPDANGAPAKSVSDLRLLVLPGNPSTPANEADARYEVSITDVRNKADLTDYGGALKLDAPLQITDRNNPDVDGGSPNATGSQPSFPVTVPCAPTGDTTVGSTCSITTTANTLAPGAAVEGQRAIWETGQTRVTDGGADGNPATADGEGLFLVQGVFIP